MLSFNEFLSNGNRPQNWPALFRLSDEYGLDSTEVITPANKILHTLKRESFNKYVERKLSYIVADINFREICENIGKPELNSYIKNTPIASFCSGRYNTIMYDMLVEKIKDDCENRKIIFININAEEYCLDREEEDNYCAHGVCAMLVPRKGKGYDMYYMNPHGEVMKSYTYFEKVITRTRCKRFDFGKDIVDCVVIKAIVDYCNKNFELEIYYDSTLQHNYYGVNLQEEDVHGVCYIFPSVIYYYFGKYFTEKRELEINGEKKTLPSFKDMLKTGKFNLAIHSCFMDFNKNYKKVIFDTIYSKQTHEEVVELLIKCLNKSSYHFLKKVTNTMVSFICQEYFIKKIK